MYRLMLQMLLRMLKMYWLSHTTTEEALPNDLTQTVE